MVLIDDPPAKSPPPADGPSGSTVTNPFLQPYTDVEPLPPPSYEATSPSQQDEHELASPRAPLLPPTVSGTSGAGLEGGEDAPPVFSVFRPRFVVMNSGNVVSHDPHLNEDGEALYRWLLSQSDVRPSMEIRVVGTHSTTVYVESVRRDAHGREQVHRTPRHDTVTDFSFRIDLSKFLNPPPEPYTVPDEEPAYRGEMYRETFIGGKKRPAAFRGSFESLAWRKDRARTGKEPWAWKGKREKGSRTVREWADEFCASPKVLKEFEYRKEVYGWDLVELEKMIQQTARKAFYHGMVQVTFPQGGTRTFIRPNSYLSRMMTITPIRIMLWLLCIYPFILLYKYCWPTGGGKWAVAGEGWTYSVRSGGQLRPLSLQQWFNVWERRIRHAIEERVQSEEVLQTVEDYYFPDGRVTA